MRAGMLRGLKIPDTFRAKPGAKSRVPSFAENQRDQNNIRSEGRLLMKYKSFNMPMSFVTFDHMYAIFTNTQVSLHKAKQPYLNFSFIAYGVLSRSISLPYTVLNTP